MKVRITSYSDPLNWYADQVGQVFEVVDYSRLEYVVREDYLNRNGAWRHIAKEDCELLPATANSPEFGGIKTSECMNTVKPSDVVTITFHIMQNGKPIAKEVKMTRDTFLTYNAKPKKKWADMYEMLVRDKAYIQITDLSNSN